MTATVAFLIVIGLIVIGAFVTECALCRSEQRHGDRTPDSM